jgi:hypothetical protein
MQPTAQLEKANTHEFMSESSSQHSFTRCDDNRYSKLMKENEGIQPTQPTYKPYNYLQKSSSTLS